MSRSRTAASEQARHQQRWKQQLPWARAYRYRMQHGLELCRHCAAAAADDSPLTLAHLTPHADGGAFTPWNVTILCGPCNIAQDRDIWPHLLSLAEEEDAAPESRRWSEIASRLARRTREAPCPVCSEPLYADERGKLRTHWREGVRCPGSQSGVLPKWLPEPAVFGAP